MKRLRLLRLVHLPATTLLFAALAACASPSSSKETAPAPEAAPDGSSRRTNGGPGALAPTSRTTAPAQAGLPPAASNAAATTALGPDGGGGDAGALDAGALDATTGSAAGAQGAQGAPGAGGEAAAPIVADNKVKPPEASEELQARAKALFEAIVKDDPAIGDPFWFPLEPFIPLKDVKGPEKYWKNLHAAYGADIHKLHKKRKSWAGAVFKSFQIGSTPKWVKPGDEANKIGYYRSFRGKLRYELEGETYSIEVHTVISWQGRWYITHLLKFKK